MNEQWKALNTHHSDIEDDTNTVIYSRDWVRTSNSDWVILIDLERVFVTQHRVSGDLWIAWRVD